MQCKIISQCESVVNKKSYFKDTLQCQEARSNKRMLIKTPGINKCEFVSGLYSAHLCTAQWIMWSRRLSQKGIVRWEGCDWTKHAHRPVEQIGPDGGTVMSCNCQIESNQILCAQNTSHLNAASDKSSWWAGPTRLKRARGPTVTVS